MRIVQRAPHRCYRVWTHRGSASAVHVYEAPNAREAIAQARAELEMFEAFASLI
jgi:hypothetical protein